MSKEDRSPPTAPRAYQRDPYLRELDAEIVELGVDGGRRYAILDDTVLYPEGGGQPADHGRLGEVAVDDVQRIDGRIRHYVAAPVETGPTTVRVDWSRRFDHMQQHTAQHLITAVAADLFGWETTSFHLGIDQSDVELDVEKIDARRATALEDRVAEVVRQARPVLTRQVDRAQLEGLGARTRGLPEGLGTVRLVEIEGIDRNACGGTHVASTAEIEAIKIIGTEPMRGGTRLYWIAGERVRRRLAALLQSNRDLRGLLEASDEEIIAVAAAKLQRLRDIEKRWRNTQRRRAEEAAAGLLARDQPLIDAHFDAADGAFLTVVARQIAAVATPRWALLTADDGSDGAFFAVVATASSGISLAQLGPRIAVALDGRGGGRGPVFQGTAGSLQRRRVALEILAACAADDR